MWLVTKGGKFKSVLAQSCCSASIPIGSDSPSSEVDWDYSADSMSYFDFSSNVSQNQLSVLIFILIKSIGLWCTIIA